MVNPVIYGNGGLSGSSAGDHGLNKSSKVGRGLELAVDDMVAMLVNCVSYTLGMCGDGREEFELGF